MQTGDRSKVVLVNSPTGGAGASTICGHLGLAIARMQQFVLLIEAVDEQTPHPLFANPVQLQPQACPYRKTVMHHAPEQLSPNLWRWTVPAHSLVEDVIDFSANGEPNTWVIVDPGHTGTALSSGLKEQMGSELLSLQAIAADTSHISKLTRASVEELGRVLLTRLDPRRALSKDIDRVLCTALGDSLLARLHHDEFLAEGLAMGTNVFDYASESLAASQLHSLAREIVESADDAWTTLKRQDTSLAGGLANV